MFMNDGYIYIYIDMVLTQIDYTGLMKGLVYIVY